MKRYLLPLLLLLPTLAAAQAQNPFSCADVEILEPGWVCHEHMGFNFPGWEGIVGNLTTVGVDSKGALYRGWTETLLPITYCGNFTLDHTYLRRYSPGYGADRMDLAVDLFRIEEQCEGGTITAATVRSVIPISPDVIVARVVVNGSNHWLIRLEREPVGIQHASLSDDFPVTSVLDREAKEPKLGP